MSAEGNDRAPPAVQAAHLPGRNMRLRNPGGHGKGLHRALGCGGEIPFTFRVNFIFGLIWWASILFLIKIFNQIIFNQVEDFKVGRGMIFEDSNYHKK